ncbi:SPFH domain-containing protein [Nocardioides sp. zg-1228]|uniref:SPFH domain-containing protein n=1 Tax=Nocardioides sp. zg-1228 TaxID=2763008 RepID=UPI0016435C86|nr:SPFH domain-containing protein [Nocardioides sp. zg-1228]MBC2934671.1 SPFH domain-containing protein [Nocardioides sp. zg-1228]QSF55990.1 SPFH domain-containing protein [Nocardioides sp. zg-1228]
MGLFQAVSGAIGGTLADQWLDFFGVPEGISATAAVFPAVRKDQNAGRGANPGASDGIITDGSKIVVPEGYGLVLMEDGAFTGFAAQPGGYIWDSGEPSSQSVFSGGGLVESIVKQSWERFKFGGRPGAQQTALFVALKELPNNKFGTQSEIYWDDAFLNTQVGAVTRGTYTLKITDPLTFIRNFVPAGVIEGRAVFDFTDLDNPAGEQLFNEVVGSLAPAFSMYTNDPAKGNRIARLQQDSVGFAQSLSAAVEDNYRWRTDRGLEIVKTAIISIEYDATTRELLANVQRADALSGARGNANLQASVAAGIEAAGENAGPGGVIGMGMAAGGMGLGGLQQPTEQAPAAPTPADAPAAPAAEDPVAMLTRAKQMLDAGLITQEDYDAAKAKALGL